MLASLARIAVLIGLSAAAWIYYPKIKPLIQPALSNPKVLGAQIAAPVVSTINSVLPSGSRLPTSAPQSGSNSAPSTTAGNTLNTIVDDVKQKAGDAAQSQIETIKTETGNAFCQALVETIKKQCGLP